MSIRQAKPDLGVFIGRLNPLHDGHLHAIRNGLRQVDHLVIALGSATGRRTLRDPLTYSERLEMLHLAFTSQEYQRVTVVPIRDVLYNDFLWAFEVRKKVNAVAKSMTAKHISLVGFRKDNSSYYLSFFPEWSDHGKGIDVGPYRRDGHPGMLSSSYIRNNMFVPGNPCIVGGVPDKVREYLLDFMKTEAFEDLRADASVIRKYRKDWGEGPFVTADPVIVQSGHVALVKRPGRPMRGTLALPGGFLENGLNETLQQAALREASEEVGVDVPPGLLYGSNVISQTFDAPFRDPRARIITTAFLFRLPDRPVLPKLVPRKKEQDDGIEPGWYPIDSLNESLMYADHYHILRRVLELSPR